MKPLDRGVAQVSQTLVIIYNKITGASVDTSQVHHKTITQKIILKFICDQ